MSERKFNRELHEHKGFAHTHAWGGEKHDHMLRAICRHEECKNEATHNIHPAPKDNGIVLNFTNTVYLDGD